MRFDSDYLASRLTALACGSSPRRWIVAYSGGLDSTALLHAANEIAERPTLLAAHVRHDLHEDAGDWQRACRATARDLDVEFVSMDVEVPRDSGLGLEAAAREQRYAALQSIMRPGDWLLSAHHQHDQAETLLLNLMRGSGVHGLAGIGAVRKLGPGLLVRPLLEVPREALQHYADSRGLDWLDDPGNEQQQFDRNYLRHEVLPVLRRRWPAAMAKIARSSQFAREAAALLDDLAAQDLAALGDAQRIDIAALTSLPYVRQKNVIRHAVRSCALPQVSDAALTRILGELVPARDDAEPCVRWAHAEARRYRGHLYLMTKLPVDLRQQGAILSSAQPELLLEDLGCLYLGDDAPVAIRADILRDGLELRFRQGGERLRLVGRKATSSLKKLLQERGIVPWMRKDIPLLYRDTDLVAVADLWVADGCQADAGKGICWRDRPALY